jgi:type II secretory pathway predicted ATPase ExeA
MDYMEFYNLKEQPFTNAVDNRFYYNSAQHSEALVRLKYSARTRKGLALLVGDIGTGKTTLARRVLDELDENEYEAALLVIIHSAVTTEWLLRKIAMQIGIQDVKEDKVELLGQLYRRLMELHESGKKVVVLIDEAQMLQGREIMEEFRGLLNMEVPEGKLVTFIFFALPEIDKNLSLDEPLKQRIAIRYTLRSFQEDATKEYIKHRLHIAGCDGELFTDKALSSIYRYSKGIPRLINTICDNALLEGFLVKRKVVDEDIINNVAQDLGLSGDAKSTKERSSVV